MDQTPLLLLIGSVLPAVMGFITRKISDSDARFWASTGICLVVGLFVNIVEHNGSYTGLSLSEIVYSIAASASLLFTATKISYEGVWNNKEVGKLLPENIVTGTQTPLKAMGLKPETK